jgi:hypothetical protein
VSAQGLLEGRGSHFLEPETEDLAVGAEALEGPGQVGLNRDADSAAGGEDAEENAGVVRAPEFVTTLERTRGIARCYVGLCGRQVQCRIWECGKLVLGSRCRENAAAPSPKSANAAGISQRGGHAHVLVLAPRLRGAARERAA